MKACYPHPQVTKLSIERTAQTAGIVSPLVDKLSMGWAQEWERRAFAHAVDSMRSCAGSRVGSRLDFDMASYWQRP